jgi:hypothetical protein
MELWAKVQVLRSAVHIFILIHSFSDQSRHANQPDDMATIPCEYCQVPIEWHRFEEHMVS